MSLTQSTNDESMDSLYVVVGNVLEPVHSGRVWCLYMGATPNYTFRNIRFWLSDSGISYVISTWPSNFLQEKYTHLKSHLKNTSDLSKNVSEFDSPMDTSESDLPMDARGLYVASNIW